MNINYTPKYVAFIDVLGFTELVTNNSKEKLEKYFDIVELAFEIFKKHRRKLTKLAISDSIILISEDSQESFVLLLDAIQTLQVLLARRDIWVRGGISFGDVFFDEQSNTIVGKGFINAYLLEKEAVYPRVIIDPMILDKQKVTRREFYDNLNKAPHERISQGKLIHDYGLGNHVRFTVDDSIFVCYANKILTRSISGEYKLAPGEASDIELVYSHLKKNLYGSQKHYPKYLWLKKYFQEVMHEYRSSQVGEESEKKQVVEKSLINFMNL